MFFYYLKLIVALVVACLIYSYFHTYVEGVEPAVSLLFLIVVAFVFSLLPVTLMYLYNRKIAEFFLISHQDFLSLNFRERNVLRAAYSDLRKKKYISYENSPSNIKAVDLLLRKDIDKILRNIDSQGKY